MRKFKLLTLLASAMMTANMWATPASLGDGTGLSWELVGTTLTITFDGEGTGVMPNYKKSGSPMAPWYSSASSITAVSLPSGLTVIGNYAFYQLKNESFTSVTIPSSVTAIGSYAFTACWGLTTINVLNGTSATTIGTAIFNGCSAISRINVPDAISQDYANEWYDYWTYLYETTSGNHVPAWHFNGDFGEDTDNLHWDVLGSVLTITGSGSTGNIGFSEPWNKYKGVINTVYLTFSGATHLYSDDFFGMNATDNVYLNIAAADLTWDEDGDDFKDDKATNCYVSSNPSVYITKFSDVNVNFTLEGVSNYESGDCDLSLEGGTMTISKKAGEGTGAMTDYANAAAQPWNGQITDITSIVINEGVTAIGDYAFDGCSNLTSIVSNAATAPALGTDAFNGHNAGLNISYPCLSASSYSTTWSSLSSCFGDCIIPENTCGSGLVWDITANVLTISREYEGTGVMTNYLSEESRPWHAQASSITSIVINGTKNGGVKSIGTYAFMGCNNASLTSISIPSSVTSIGLSAFKDCSSLTSIAIPSGVTTIPGSAFSGCSSLTSVTIPATVTAIGSFAFNNCSALESITLPAGLTSIENSIFYHCSSLTSITIPSGVTSIGNLAFGSCSGLTSIVIPSGVTTIGTSAFSSCTGITSIDIPSKVTSIGETAFSSCSNLVTVNARPTTAPSLGSNVFASCMKLDDINYHCGCTSSYSTRWSAYSAKLVEDCENQDVTAKVDPEDATAYYSTFYDGSRYMELPAGAEAYVAEIDGGDLLLTLLAEGGEVIPAGTAVIIKYTSSTVALTESTTFDTYSGANDLRGTDVAMSAPANCYVLSGKAADNSVTGVGFYKWTSTVPAHKAYIVLSPKTSSAPPTRMRFVIGNKAPTSIGEVESDDVQTIKVIENGQFFIIKNGVRYNAQGQIVK